MKSQDTFISKATKFIVDLLLRAILFMVIGFTSGFVVGAILKTVFDLSPAINMAVSTPIILLSTLFIINYKKKEKSNE